MSYYNLSLDYSNSLKMSMTMEVDSGEHCFDYFDGFDEVDEVDDFDEVDEFEEDLVDDFDELDEIEEEVKREMIKEIMKERSQIEEEVKKGIMNEETKETEEKDPIEEVRDEETKETEEKDQIEEQSKEEEGDYISDFCPSFLTENIYWKTPYELLSKLYVYNKCYVHSPQEIHSKVIEGLKASGYDTTCTCVHDCLQHLEYDAKLAAQVQSITEFGLRKPITRESNPTLTYIKLKFPDLINYAISLVRKQTPDDQMLIITEDDYDFLRLSDKSTTEFFNYLQVCNPHTFNSIKDEKQLMYLKWRNFADNDTPVPFLQFVDLDFDLVNRFIYYFEKELHLTAMLFNYTKSFESFRSYMKAWFRYRRSVKTEEEFNYLREKDIDSILKSQFLKTLSSFNDDQKLNLLLSEEFTKYDPCNFIKEMRNLIPVVQFFEVNNLDGRIFSHFVYTSKTYRLEFVEIEEGFVEVFRDKDTGMIKNYCLINMGVEQSRRSKIHNKGRTYVCDFDHKTKEIKNFRFVDTYVSLNGLNKPKKFCSRDSLPDLLSVLIHSFDKTETIIKDQTSKIEYHQIISCIQ